MPYVWRCQISYNGSGTFNINTAGQPVVTGTVISSTAFNALTSDLGTGLSTAITKDGQTTATARIPFAAGINSSLVTDATSTTTGSIITAGGVGIAKALYVGTTANIAGASTLAAVNASTLVTTTSIGVGNVTLSGSGSGVQFPATQSASTDVNTLDDYEEGTWTPGISFGNGTTGITYATATNGFYTKIGRMVTVTGYLGLTNKGSSTGTSKITGLPFTSNAGTGGEQGDFASSIGYVLNVTYSGALTIYGGGGTTMFPLSIASGASPTNLSDTAFANSSGLTFSFSYVV